MDALSLRIELGAIGPDTELYDAQADRWGPAKSHEIYNTLSRGSSDEGFVAPPPPVAPTPSASAGGAGSAAPPVEPDEPEVGEEEAVEEETPPPAEEPAASPASEELAEDPAAFDFDLAEDLVDEGLDALELTDDAAAPEPEEEAPAEEEGAFDFGGMDTLEVEEEEEEPAGPDLGGGMKLEETLGGEEAFAGMDDSEGGLELEKPMSDFSSDAPPSWMEQTGPDEAAESGDGSMDFTPSSGEDELAAAQAAAQDRGAAGAARRPKRERPTPRDRPSPPKRRPAKRSLAGPVIGVVVLALLGGGGWYGWQAFQARSAEPEVPALPPVTIPDIPAEFLPTMRDLGEVALAGTIDEMDAMASSAELPAEPRDDWLSGAYMANASQFADVEAYWEAVDDFLRRIRQEDTQLFHQEYEEALAAAEITGDTASMLLERADSGFLATREDRFEVYGQMEDLIAAALDLHLFLLDNERRIRFDPAAGGMSADPVMEAIPATEELGEEMWDRVDRITGSLDRLGTLDRVTTERLLAVLFDRIRRAGFR